MYFIFRLSFQPAGEIYAIEQFTDNTDKIAATRIRARFKPMPRAWIFRIVRSFARQRREIVNRAAVKTEALETASLLPISSAIETPDKERFS